MYNYCAIGCLELHQAPVAAGQSVSSPSANVAAAELQSAPQEGNVSFVETARGLCIPQHH